MEETDGELKRIADENDSKRIARITEWVWKVCITVAIFYMAFKI